MGSFYVSNQASLLISNRVYIYLSSSSSESSSVPSSSSTDFYWWVIASSWSIRFHTYLSSCRHSRRFWRCFSQRPMTSSEYWPVASFNSFKFSYYLTLLSFFCFFLSSFFSDFVSCNFTDCACACNFTFSWLPKNDVLYV